MGGLTGGMGIQWVRTSRTRTPNPDMHTHFLGGIVKGQPRPKRRPIEWDTLGMKIRKL